MDLVRWLEGCDCVKGGMEAGHSGLDEVGTGRREQSCAKLACHTETSPWPVLADTVDGTSAHS